MIFNLEKSVNQRIRLSGNLGIEMYIKRDDLIHVEISGNKYRKLKYNIIEAQKLGLNTLLTFGGAYSNHIAATAAVGRDFVFKTIGIIRGEELYDKIDENPTLSFARQCGMQFKFVSRSEYREKTSQSFINNLKDEFGQFYHVPEGGTNDLAIKGCEEILSEKDKEFDFVCSSVGTGGTISGLINSSNTCQQVFGFSALKGDFLKNEIIKFAKQDNWHLVTDYHFGGYGKVSKELIDFVNDFKKDNNIPLDPVYTGKMMFGIFDLINKGFFQKESEILAIHTGGLQGIKGMNIVLKKKELPIISI